jgi:hypothetical protein
VHQFGGLVCHVATFSKNFPALTYCGMRNLTERLRCGITRRLQLRHANPEPRRDADAAEADRGPGAGVGYAPGPRSGWLLICINSVDA